MMTCVNDNAVFTDNRKYLSSLVNCTTHEQNENDALTSLYRSDHRTPPIERRYRSLVRERSMKENIHRLGRCLGFHDDDDDDFHSNFP
jgi:hypothetical protein